MSPPRSASSASELPHDSAHTHVAGTSEFIDDRARLAGELEVVVLFSPHAHARIKSIRTEQALAIPGVVAVYCAKDFAHNLWGSIIKDQPLLAEQEVQFVGEAVAIIAAETREAAYRGREAVAVEYEVLPAILSIDEARAARSFIGARRTIERGDATAAFASAPHTLAGQLVLRGADHFYLESQASIVYPHEDGQLEVHSSSQHPTETQHVVAHGLGLPDHDVVCVVKRMGGGFGGKESQAAPFAAYAALVAHRLRRPARIVLNKDDDMIMTGKRNPFQNHYRVAFDDAGRLLALEVDFFSDGGAYADLSTSIMERAMLHADNAYFIPHVKVAGQVCRTNFHPHTAFRGFGGPKGVATIEVILERIAAFLKQDALDLRKLNCYTAEGGRDVTHYDQKLENNCLPQLFAELERSSDYRRRRREIVRSNDQARVTGAPLRGLSLTAVKFGISFTTRFLNQANALVLVHRDGTLQVGTGATEMGQGVNARIAELVARELGLPRSTVRILPTATDRNANTSPTAASSGTDLNGAAALLAARKLKVRLSQLAVALAATPEERWASNTAGLGTQAELGAAGRSDPLDDPNEGADWATGIATYHGVRFADGRVHLAGLPGSPAGPGKRTRRGSISFAALVNEAYLNRISLSEYAHYSIPGLAFDKLAGKGPAFLYFTQGTAVSEVSVDQDSGTVKVLRTDILMDLGRPVNEPLDLGQVSGAFIQGMGWVTTEKLFYDRKGALLSHAPSTYKIPNVQDTPRDFRIRLLGNEENRANVRGTKAAGEPPLLLALSVWTAIGDAVAQSPERDGAWPQLEVPATQEECLRALAPARFWAWERATP
ncbi:MAG: xanthine dehydrogenase molybdopterin binding subunit [Myxococcales bacterium]|nr:xanthine dehydrogenase molybdopterin binding subunit [Myxococcales bacterium]